MLKKFKAPLTAILLSSVALVPAATVAFVASADVAIAKSDNAGGGGKGNGREKSSKSKVGTKGKSGTTTASGGGSKSRGGGGLEKFFDKITGKDKAQAAKTRKTSTSSAKVAEVTPKIRPEKGPMHPSNLGKMNGPMNANINAVLAHIKNGNTNGPIGAFSALAVAGANAEGAQEVLDLKQDFVDLQTALDGSPYETLEDYFAALQGEEPIEPIGPIEDALTAIGEAEASQSALAAALEDAGFTGETALADYEQAVMAGGPASLNVEGAKTALIDPSTLESDLTTALTNAGYEGTDPLADYLADKEGTPPADPINELDEAVAVLGGNSAEGTAPTATEPSEEEVAGAEADLQAQSDAELAMLEHWNKNPDSEPEVISEEEQAILDALYERLEPYSEEISAALPAEEVIEEEMGEEGEVVAECAEGDAECAAGEEIAAAE